MSLKIASINVEGLKNTERVLNFLRHHPPDVLCLQELYPEDIRSYEKFFGAPYGSLLYVPVNGHGIRSRIGLGILANRPLLAPRICGYDGSPHPREVIPAQINEMLLFVSVVDGKSIYRIGTTHVRVTREGRVTRPQMRSMTDLVKVAREEADTFGGLLLTGDFNAPRGRRAFDLVASHFRDGVPKHYHSSLDPELHRIRNKKLNRMVDGLFYTPSYVLEDATLHTGVSDHCALTATLSER